MKINKILTPILAVASIGTIATPLMTLTSCNKETNKLIPVPVENMKFDESQIEQYGKGFKGFVEGTDLSKYNAVVLPDDVNWVMQKSFSSLTKANNSNIKTIVFGKNITKMNKYSFYNSDSGEFCETVTKFDFSKCEYIHEIEEQNFSNRTFEWLPHNHLGTIIANTNKVTHNDLLTLFLRKGLPGEWLQPNEWTTTTWTHHGSYEWKSHFTPLSFADPKTSAEAIQSYANEVKAVPSIFIDDFMRAYAQIPLSQGITSLTQTVGNVVINNNDNNTLGSFNLQFVSNKSESETAYKLDVSYKDMPLTMITPLIHIDQGSTCAIVFEKSKIGSTSWLSGSSISISGWVNDLKIEDVYIHDEESFQQFVGQHTTDGLYTILYDAIEIPSSYYKNLVISNE